MKHLFFLGSICLTIVGCASSGQQVSTARNYDPQAVVGKTWQWVGMVTPVEKTSVQQPERYTLRFDEKGRLQAKFDCNRGGGGYQISEGKLSFGPMMSTRMACPEGSLDYVFMKQLNEVTSFYVEGDSLYLELPTDSGTLQFKHQEDDDY